MGPPDPTATRRSALAGGAALLGGALAGCVVGRPGAAGGSHPGAGTSGGRTGPVSILAAGSLNNALENGLAPALAEEGLRVRVEAHGSAEVARLVAGGQKDPDIVSLADVSLFDGPLHPDWYAEFATNAMVLAYDPDSRGGRALAEAGPEEWYRPVLDGDVSLGRTDPDLDPLGYRTLFVLDLATEYYGTDVDLRDAIPEPDQVYPETQLISQFETGSIDAAFAYRSMAEERDYAALDLPPEIDLGDPAHESRYETTTYTLPDGKTVRGGLVSYASTTRDDSPTVAVSTVFSEHTTGDYLRDFGFAVPADYPRYTGDVPDEIDT